MKREAGDAEERGRTKEFFQVSGYLDSYEEEILHSLAKELKAQHMSQTLRLLLRWFAGGYGLPPQMAMALEDDRRKRRMGRMQYIAYVLTEYYLRELANASKKGKTTSESGLNFSRILD
jgi:hypothetical protein